MSNQKMYVAIDRSIVEPHRNVRWVSSGVGRKTKVGDGGKKLPGGSELSSEFLDYARNKKESNGQTLLQNLIENGSIVFEPNTRSPLVEAPKALPVERFVEPNQRRS